MGLASIPRRCRNLTKLYVVECGSDLNGEWLSSFPARMLSLEVLQFPYLRSYADFNRLENLLARCCNIKVLNVMRHGSVDQLKRLLWYAARLNEFRVGEINPNHCLEIEADLNHSLSNCDDLHALSIIWPAYGDEPPAFLPGLYTLCRSLSFLDLRTAALRPQDLELLSSCPQLRCLWVTTPQDLELLSSCPQLRCLWVMDTVQVEGLIEVAFQCKLLEDVRVFPEEPSGKGAWVLLLLMTNEAISRIVGNWDSISHFRLGILSKVQHDYKTNECFDSSARHRYKYEKLKRVSVFGML